MLEHKLPRAKLDVAGAITSGPAVAEAGGSVDFAGSNYAYTASSCGAFSPLLYERWCFLHNGRTRDNIGHLFIYGRIPGHLQGRDQLTLLSFHLPMEQPRLLLKLFILLLL